LDQAIDRLTEFEGAIGLAGARRRLDRTPEPHDRVGLGSSLPLDAGGLQVPSDVVVIVVAG
jgi:hypothetical protein